MNKEREAKLRFIARLHNHANKKEIESLIDDCKKFESKSKRQEELINKYRRGQIKPYGQEVIF